MTGERGDEAAWDAQRRAQRHLTLEERIRQNDALARLWAGSVRGGARSGSWVAGTRSA